MISTVAIAPPGTVSRRRFNIEEYYRMARAGILTEDDRVELIDGEVLEMTPIGPRHAITVDRLNELLVIRLAGTAIVRVQSPIRLSDDTEPEPDLAVLRRRSGYGEAHPTADDVLLLIEVAETSADYDRGIKLPRYARAGIPETWLVDLTGDIVEQYTGPRADQYNSKQTLERGQTISAQSISLSLPVDAIFDDR